MNLPSGTARQSGITQFQCIARVRDVLMGFADDDAVDAYPPRPNPLFGAVFRRARILPQQPIQQGGVFGLDHISDRQPRSVSQPSVIHGVGASEAQMSSSSLRAKTWRF